MIPRAELEELLNARLEGRLTTQGLTDLLRAIQELEEEWEEIAVIHRDMGYSMSVNCTDICYLADQVEKGAVIRMFRKKQAPKAN